MESKDEVIGDYGMDIFGSTVSQRISQGGKLVGDVSVTEFTVMT